MNVSFLVTMMKSKFNMCCYLWITCLLAITSQLSSSEEISDNPIATVQKGILDFGVKLNAIIQSKNSQNKNILISPYNIYTALGLLHLGTDGVSRAELTNVLGIPPTYSTQKIHEVLQNFSQVVQDYGGLRSTLPNGTIAKVKVTDLEFANGIFIQDGLNLKQNFIEGAQTYYDSEIVNVDFAHKGKEAIDHINSFVANRTENNIPKLYSEPQPSDTRIILASCLYFKSLWKIKFNDSLTQPEPFYTDKENITVNMMHGLDLMGKGLTLRYGDISSQGVETVQMDYANHNISMYVIKPYDNQTLHNFLTDLTSDKIKEILEKTSIKSYVDLKLPRTAFKWSKDINDELSQLGMKEIFSNNANLNNMIYENNLKVSKVGHSTHIEISEDGTKASAVTTVNIGLRKGTPKLKHIQFHVRRPFSILIYHRVLEAVLFFGSVFNPNGN